MSDPTREELERMIARATERTDDVSQYFIKQLGAVAAFALRCMERAEAAEADANNLRNENRAVRQHFANEDKATLQRQLDAAFRASSAEPSDDSIRIIQAGVAKMEQFYREMVGHDAPDYVAIELRVGDVRHLLAAASRASGAPRPLGDATDDQLRSARENSLADLALAELYEHNHHLIPAIREHLAKIDGEIQRRASGAPR